MPSRSRIAVLGAVTLAALGLAASRPAAAQNSIITFSNPAALSGDTDVSTAGTLYQAFYNGAGGLTSIGTPTVNGVTFTAGTLTGTTNVAVTNVNGGPYNPGTAFNPALSANYSTVVNTAIYNNTGAAPTLGFTISGLKAGNQYRFQFFVDEPRNTSKRTETLSDGVGSTSGLLTFDGGSYLFGTFTANTVGTETFTVTGLTPGAGGFGDTAAQVNAFQIRNLSPAPEPSQVAGLGLGLLGLAGLALKARRRQSVA